MTLDDLIARCEADEGLELEFKAAAGGLPASLWETLSAFANTSGGWLLLGVRQDGRKIAPVGVKSAAKLRQDLANLLRNPEKISREVCGPEDIQIERVGGAELIVLRVRAAASKDKPVYINGNPYKGTFVRRNEGDYRCTKQEVDRMIRDGSAESADSAVLKGYGWEHIERDTFKRYRERFRQFNAAHAWTEYDDDRFLTAIGGHRNDPETGAEGFTRAAILMFGKTEAILNLRVRHLIDFRLLPEDEDSTRWLDRIVWEGNLFDAFSRIYPRLVEPLKVPFKLQGPHRLAETPAHEALRECLVNTLAHADYAEQAALLIKASPREFVFRNPGSSRVPEQDLLTKDRSDPRNPVLLRMFRHVELAEEAGSGLPKVLRVWREEGLQLPSLHSDTERYEFQLKLRLVHLLSEQDRAWLAKCVRHQQERDIPALLSQHEQTVLVQAREVGSINNAAAQALTGLHRADVTKLLVGLRERGLLRQRNANRWSFYRLSDAAMNFYESIPKKKAPRSSYKEKGFKKKRFPASTGKATERSDQKKSAHKKSAHGKSAHKKSAHIPAKKVEKLKERIIELCRVPKSAAQLADLLKKNPRHLRAYHLKPMVEAGLLKYTRPENPNARGQKYTAVK